MKGARIYFLIFVLHRNSNGRELDSLDGHLLGQLCVTVPVGSQMSCHKSCLVQSRHCICPCLGSTDPVGERNKFGAFMT